MDEIRTAKVRTYEELVMERISKAFIAKDDGDDYLFDEILDEIEMLFKLRTDIFPVFSKMKREMDVLVKQNIQKVSMETATINDEILKELYKTQKEAIIKWEYRSDMLENILNILNEFQMVPYTNPLVGEMGFGDLDEIQGEEEATFEVDGEPEEPEQIAPAQTQNPPRQIRSQPIPRKQPPQSQPKYSNKNIKRKPTFPDR